MKKIRTRAKPVNTAAPLEEANRRLAREAAAESIILLKNDGALPLSPCPIALYGAGAATTIKGGTGSGEVNERYSVTIEQGLTNAGFSITTSPWLREYETVLKAEKEAHAKELGKKLIWGGADGRINIMSDSFQYPFGRRVTIGDTAPGGEACLYVVARQGGECSDRNLDKYEYHLSPQEIENLKTVASVYRKTILVINTGASMDLGPLDEIEGINAILYYCQQGMEGGNALADIVTGAVSPSGCLASTWARKYEDLPNAMEYSYLKGHTDFEEYREGIYVGYRYFDSFGVNPRYEFGFGHSYTDFSIEVIRAYAEGTVVSVVARIINTGSRYTGKRVIQLYVSAPSGALQREFQSLAAFAKTEALEPWQAQDLTLSFDIAGLAGYDESAACYILEQGAYIIRVGESSMNTDVVAVALLDETVTTETCRNLCKIDRDMAEIEPAAYIMPDIPATAVRLQIKASDFTPIYHSYEPPKRSVSPVSEKILSRLEIDDFYKIVTGTGLFDKKPFLKVPGAAANTTSHLSEMGVPNTALCDGPAGLRLSRVSVQYGSGVIKPVDSLIDIMESLPKIIKMLIQGNPKRGAALYQYASAFPSGAAMAQTWNTDLLERVGDAVGAEMDEYGVTFLLAPAMNIVRNPLCGRNFEYYSEDPLLTGRLAAAATRGVQSHNGCYVTIKHFAANNQETNRNKSNSVIGERALREIYLKGYRIAVEEGGAKAVMTSYNKLNGTYTPESYDLCTNILRCEWGFNGVVMTDWFSTGKGLASNGLAVKAGNDLIMPGGKSYRKRLKADYTAGLVSGDELKLCAARVLEAVLNSNVAAMYGDLSAYGVDEAAMGGDEDGQGGDTEALYNDMEILYSDMDTPYDVDAAPDADETTAYVETDKLSENDVTPHNEDAAPYADDNAPYADDAEPINEESALNDDI